MRGGQFTQARMVAPLAEGSPAVLFTGPPADRMAGRSAARAAAAKPKGNYTPKANATLSADQAIDQAIHQGIIGANMAAHYKVLWQADPIETRQYLEKLGLYPEPLASGPAGNPDPHPEQIAASQVYDDSALSRAERGRIAAAREGRTGRVISGGL
jgi:hypothetical protein